MMWVEYIFWKFEEEHVPTLTLIKIAYVVIYFVVININSLLFR